MGMSALSMPPMSYFPPLLLLFSWQRPCVIVRCICGDLYYHFDFSRLAQCLVLMDEPIGQFDMKKREIELAGFHSSRMIS